MADEKSEEEPTLLDLLKQHIRLEDDMDPSMLQFYLDAADKYVQRKVGHSVKYLQLMVATVMNDNRSAGDDLAAALEALEPIFLYYADIGITSTEKYLAQQNKQDVVLRILIRRDMSITQGGNRVRIRGTDYKITRIYETPDNQRMELSLDYVDHI